MYIQLPTAKLSRQLLLLRIFPGIIYIETFDIDNRILYSKTVQFFRNLFSVVNNFNALRLDVITRLFDILQ